MNAITGEHPVEREEIMMFMDGELAAGRAVFVSRHLESCPACHRALADFRATSQCLSHWAVHPAPVVLPAWPENRLSRFLQVLRPRYLAAMVGVAMALTFWAQTSPSRIQLSEREVRAKLTKREAVQVKYPEEAKQKGIQGVVHIHIVVGRNGSVKQLDVVQGDPVLAKAATEAVRKWKFEPTLVRGKAVEVESVVEIQFQLVD